MISKLFSFLGVLILVLSLGCKSTDGAPVTPEEEATPSSELDQARMLIGKIEAVDGAKYLPDELNSLKEMLSEAEAVEKSNRDEHNRLVDEILTDGQQTYETSFSLFSDEIKSSLTKLDTLIVEKEGDLFRPDEYSQAKGAMAEVFANIENENISALKGSYLNAHVELYSLYEVLDNELRWVGLLQRNINRSLNEAEEAQAYIWVPEELSASSDLYNEGLDYLARYQLDESINSLQNSASLSGQLVDLSERRKRLKQTDSHMEDVQRLLDRVDPKETEEAWTDEFLTNTPLKEVTHLEAMEEYDEDQFAEEYLSLFDSDFPEGEFYILEGDEATPVDPDSIEGNFHLLEEEEGDYYEEEYYHEEEYYYEEEYYEEEYDNGSEELSQRSSSPLPYFEIPVVEIPFLAREAIEGGSEEVWEDLEREETELEKARRYWSHGVEARNRGNYDLADEYFEQANIYLLSLLGEESGTSYTVRYREPLTDCLWRIAQAHYENPFLWPIIWKKNRTIIQNPDLIYPGQVLAIPPQ